MFKVIWFPLALTIFTVILIDLADTKHKICKKISHGKDVDQYPLLATYFKAIGAVTYKSVIEGNDSFIEFHRCTGVFVALKKSDFNTSKTDLMTGYFVSAAHCFADYLDKSSVLTSNGQQRLLNTGPDLTISFGNTQLNASKISNITIKVDKNPIRIPPHYSLEDCLSSQDLAVVELSQADCAKVKESGRFLGFQDISGYSLGKRGMGGENCWIAGFGGSHDKKLQLANVSYFEGNTGCLKDDCDPDSEALWQSCYERMDKISAVNNITEPGDSGAPVWCFRDGVSKVVGINTHQRVFPGKTLPTKATKAERVSDFLVEAYKNVGFQKRLSLTRVD